MFVLPPKLFAAEQKRDQCVVKVLSSVKSKHLESAVTGVLFNGVLPIPYAIWEPL